MEKNIKEEVQTKKKFGFTTIFKADSEKKPSTIVGYITDNVKIQTVEILDEKTGKVSIKEVAEVMVTIKNKHKVFEKAFGLTEGSLSLVSDSVWVQCLAWNELSVRTKSHLRKNQEVLFTGLLSHKRKNDKDYFNLSVNDFKILKFDKPKVNI